MNLHHALRARTSHQHRQLEARFAYLLDPSLSRRSYGEHLAMLWPFYRRVEPRLEAGAAPHGLASFFARRRKTPLLEDDLEALGVRTTSDRWDEGTEPALPSVDGLADVLGVAYVLEGATLGGRVLLRHLRRSVEITPSLGGRFVAGYGESTGLRWTAFLRLLNENDRGPATTEAVVTAAQRAFRSLAACHARRRAHDRLVAWNDR